MRVRPPTQTDDLTLNLPGAGGVGGGGGVMYRHLHYVLLLFPQFTFFFFAALVWSRLSATGCCPLGSTLVGKHVVVVAAWASTTGGGLVREKVIETVFIANKTPIKTTNHKQEKEDEPTGSGEGQEGETITDQAIQQHTDF